MQTRFVLQNSEPQALLLLGFVSRYHLLGFTLTYLILGIPPFTHNATFWTVVRAVHHHTKSDRISVYVRIATCVSRNKHELSFFED